MTVCKHLKGAHNEVLLKCATDCICNNYAGVIRARCRCPVKPCVLYNVRVILISYNVVVSTV